MTASGRRVAAPRVASSSSCRYQGIDFGRADKVILRDSPDGMCRVAHFAGLVAGKVLTGEYNPVSYADIITSTTHKTLRGPRGGMILCTNEYKEAVDKGCPLVLGGPMPHVMAAKAVAFKEADTKEFCSYSKQIVDNAKTLSKTLTDNGVKLVTGGTDNHLILFDVYKSFGLTGRQVELALRQSGITVNRNSIPHDVMGPWYTSGIRAGTPAITTLGMKNKEMEFIGKSIVKVLRNTKPLVINGKTSKAKYEIDQKVLEEVRNDVKEVLQNFPLYPELLIDS